MARKAKPKLAEKKGKGKKEAFLKMMMKKEKKSKKG